MIALLVILSSVFHVQPALGYCRDRDKETNEVDTPAEVSTSPDSDESVCVDDDLNCMENEIIVVTFDLRGGVVMSDFDDQHIESGEVARRPLTNPSRDGYEFVGWFTAPGRGMPFNFEIPLEANTTIYARWRAIVEVVHTVTFDFNGGEGELEVGYGLLIIIPYEVTTSIAHNSRTGNPYNQLGIQVVREGYNLIGWSTVLNSRTDMFNFNSRIREDVTLYALWESERPTILPPILEPTQPQTPQPTQPPIQEPPVLEPTQPQPQPPVLEPPVLEPPQPQPPTGPVPDLVQPPIFVQAPPNPDIERIADDEIIASGPPESSGLIMEVDEEGNVIITGPSIGEDEEIIIQNAPVGIMFLRIGAFDEMFILFPPDTVPEEVEITTPTPEWTYEFFVDVEGNLVLVLLPPGVDLAEVLNDPLNPQPADPSSLNLLSSDDEDDQDKAPEPDEDVTESDDDDTLDDDVEETTESALPTGMFSNSLALMGVFFLKCGQILLNKNKVD